MYEATTDLFYACGIDLDSPKWATGDWPGQNVTGKVLMKVRRELLEEDTLGNSADDNTLMNLSSSSTEETDSCNWPELEKSNSFTEAVKSHKISEKKGGLPKLNKSVPQFTPSRG